MGKPETNVSKLCEELKITRTTLYRYVSPEGKLRTYGKHVLEKKEIATEIHRWFNYEVFI